MKKKFLDHDSDVNFSFSNFENFLIAAFTLHVQVMSEGTGIMFAQGHHHGFELCVCSYALGYACIYIPIGRP
jgi:intracellular sulfur oxidation DsrE/DsrF family protein